jgi:plastocyanin
MRTSRTCTALAVSALLLVASCGSNNNSNKAKASPTASGPQTFAVGVDMNRADLYLPLTEFALAYFPKELTVHPGDSVSFGLNNSGEPHTVALGSLVDAVAVPYAQLTPAQKQASEPPPAIKAALAKVPQLLPEGPGDAIQAGAQPCYQATGLPSTKAACAVHTGDFTGTESLVSSGWLDPNAPFTLKVSDSARPGVYNYFCQLHGPDMAGKLTIADKAAAIPSPTDVTAAATTALHADADKLAKAAAAVAAAPQAKPVAGLFDQSFQEGGIAAFGPKNITIPVGGAVTWAVFGPHVLYFNAPASAQQLRVPAPDGAVHFNAKAAIPIGGPGAPQKPGLFDGGSWNGVGEHSSGAIFSFPPDLFRYKLRFTKAGTYSYLCTFHTGMKGTVTVG